MEYSHREDSRGENRTSLQAHSKIWRITRLENHEKLHYSELSLSDKNDYRLFLPSVKRSISDKRHKIYILSFLIIIQINEL